MWFEYWSRESKSNIIKSIIQALFILFWIKHAGDIGNIAANEEKRATFRMIDDQIKVWDIIGRSICISEKPNTRENGPNTGERLACGIIARSANVFRNMKKIWYF